MSRPSQRASSGENIHQPGLFDDPAADTPTPKAAEAASSEGAFEEVPWEVEVAEFEAGRTGGVTPPGDAYSMNTAGSAVEKPAEVYQPPQVDLEELYEGLNPRQREAVEALEGPVLIVAGAGSGKTRVLTRRIAAHIAHGAHPSEILAITFTNKAADEMRSRVQQLVGGRALNQMWVSTFHAACVKMLRTKGPIRWFSIVDAGDAQKILRGVLEDLGYDKEDLAGGFVRKVASHISRAKNHLQPPRGDNTGGVADAAAKAFAGYQAQLRAMKAYDFDDLLVETVRMLRNDADALEYFSSKFRYILIDEYQDTNRAQDAIASLLAQKHRNICVVGDPLQSVYRFRGAVVENILRFEQAWPGVRVVVLDQNYRSTKKILEAANVVRAPMVGQYGKGALSAINELWTEGAEGEKVRLHVAGDDLEEARFVAQRVKSEGRPGEHAVLFRTNAQSRALEEAMMAAGVPYKIVGGTRFYDRAEVKDALAYLRFCVNPNDVMAFNRIINTPRRGIGAKTIASIFEVAETQNVDLFDAARIASDPEVSGRGANSISKFVVFCDKVSQAIDTEGPAAALEVVLLGADGSRGEFRRRINAGLAPEKAMLESMGQTGQAAMYSRYGDDREAERLQNLFELGRAAEEFTKGPMPPTAPSGGEVAELGAREQTELYLEHVTLVSDLDSIGTDEAADAVLLMTVHAAKGLEFPHVTVVGMEDGLMPLRFGGGIQSAEDLAEERRLAYVAVTRAERTLCLTRAMRRYMYGTLNENAESEFLADIRSSVEVETSGEDASANPSSFGGGSYGGGYSGANIYNRYRNNSQGRGGSGWSGQRKWQKPSDAQPWASRSNAARPAGAAAGTPKGSRHEGSVLAGGAYTEPGRVPEEELVGDVPEGLAAGVKVRHAKFGDGVITSVRGEGDSMELTVRFEGAGMKTLIARYANLELR